MEKIWGNLKKGLRFYCRENGFSDVILGLSGGLDSAVVSVLAAEALGAEHVYCLMMKTGYTSALSLEIARELAGMNNRQKKYGINSAREFVEQIDSHIDHQAAQEKNR